MLFAAIDQTTGIETEAAPYLRDVKRTPTSWLPRPGVLPWS